MAQQGPPNGTTPQFQNLNRVGDVLDPNFDKYKAFKRAMKVFLMSYPELTGGSPQFQRTKFDDFVSEMRDLYNIRTPDMSWLAQLITDMNAEIYRVFITCKKIIGRDQLNSPELVAGIGATAYAVALDVTNDVQPYAPIKLDIARDVFVDFRSDQTLGFIIAIQEQPSQPAVQPLQSFMFPFAITSPEGWEDWIDFGRGVQMLINVEYTIHNEANITDEEVSRFYLETIVLMVDSRQKAYSSRTKWTDIGHQQTALKYKVDYLRPIADPVTDDMFWSQPKTGTQLKPVVSGAKRPAPTVKFTDMQMGFRTTEDFEENVCLCNEWCNWNAFFYYNPIYRFLMVRHRQLYVKNVSNIPDMYLCVAVMYGCLSSPTMKTPVLRLMNCANEYRKRFYINFYLKSPHNAKYKRHYKHDKPSPRVMNAVSYNKLRYEVDVTAVVHQLDVNPFADNCIEALLYYYNVLSDLHLFHSSNRAFIANKKQWYDDMDSLGRNKYGEYIKQSYDKSIVAIPGGYDHLFTVDYEYVGRLPTTDDETKVKKIRDSLLLKLKEQDPKKQNFNLKITMNDFLNTFASIYKFLARVEPMLPSAHEKPTFDEVMNCYQTLDNDFNLYQMGSTSKTFNYSMDPLNQKWHKFEKNFHVFYTLKIYFYVYEIQKHFIGSVLNYNKRVFYKKYQVSNYFDFIWENTIVEDKYLNTYQGERLYDLTIISDLVDDFYSTFWGAARHEVVPLRDYFEIMNSGNTQHKRLYFWWRNDGNNRTIFKKIIDLQNDILLDIDNRSDVVFDYMIKPIKKLSKSYPYYLEVFDHLVYYLVKAHCSVTINATALFLTPVHDLQKQRLCERSHSFSLSKPGWVPIFRTMESALSSIDGLHNKFMVFDDEFQRISETCYQTKQMIKSIYRNFYTKLSFEWYREIYVCQITMVNPSTNVSDFLLMHLMVGLSFCAAFGDDFRKQFNRARQTCLKFLRQVPNPNLPQQVDFHSCLNAVQDYLQNKNFIREALPIRTSIWRTQLFSLFARYNQFTEQQVHLDMSLADT